MNSLNNKTISIIQQHNQNNKYEDLIKKLELQYNELIEKTVHIDENIEKKRLNIKNIQEQCKKTSTDIEKYKFKTIRIIGMHKDEIVKTDGLLNNLNVFHNKFDEQLTETIGKLTENNVIKQKKMDEMLIKLKEEQLYLELELERKESEIEILFTNQQKQQQKLLIHNNRYNARSKLLQKRIEDVSIKRDVTNRRLNELKSEMSTLYKKNM